MANKQEKKLYTLEEAYNEILRIKNETVGKYYHSEQEKIAFRNGYKKAILDMQTDFAKMSNLLAFVHAY
jgi:hypothetical protein